MHTTIRHNNEEVVLTNNQINKIGNALIYLSKEFKPLYKTSALKLLYILDEFSVRNFGIPFFDLNYEVWQAGPVAPEIFSELSEVRILSDFVKLEFKDNSTSIVAKQDFNDDEFSDNDMDLLNYVVSTFKKSTAADLVEYTHKPNTLWAKLAAEHNLLADFENKRRNTSGVAIDFTELIVDDEYKLEMYNQHKEFLHFSNSHK